MTNDDLIAQFLAQGGEIKKLPARDYVSSQVIRARSTVRYDRNGRIRSTPRHRKPLKSVRFEEPKN